MSEAVGMCLQSSEVKSPELGNVLSVQGVMCVHVQWAFWTAVIRGPGHVLEDSTGTDVSVLA